jgi:FkbM family methyltransferase
MVLGQTVEKYPDLIYDVGMHKGEDTAFYLKKGFRVIGFEADPELASQCRNRFTDAVDAGKLVIVEGAVMEKDYDGDPTIKFYKNLGNSVWGSVNADWASRNAGLGTQSTVIEVNIVDFSDCIVQFGMPHFMKIDIEGNDTTCLRHLLSFEAKPDYISIESDKVSYPRLVEEIHLLEALGYDQFKAVQQTFIHKRGAPTPSEEGVSVSHQFQLGDSGVFGKDLDGEWRSKRNILRKYKRIFVGYRLIGDDTMFSKSDFGRSVRYRLENMLGVALPGWYDTHAKHSTVVS